MAIVSFVVEGWAGCNILQRLHDPRVANVLAGVCLPSALNLKNSSNSTEVGPGGGPVFPGPYPAGRLQLVVSSTSGTSEASNLIAVKGSQVAPAFYPFTGLVIRTIKFRGCSQSKIRFRPSRVKWSLSLYILA